MGRNVVDGVKEEGRKKMGDGMGMEEEGRRERGKERGREEKVGRREV